MATTPRRPRVDDRQIQNFNAGLMVYPTLLVAHKIGLFRLLRSAPMTLAQICERLKLAPRPGDAIVGVAVASGFLRRRGDGFELTSAAEDYLLEDSPTSWCAHLDALIENARIFHYENIEKSLLRDEQALYDGKKPWETHEVDQEKAAKYTRWMHSVSMGPAMVWPEWIDLSSSKTFLDIAGGSGAHAIAAALQYPGLRCVVFDLENVCKVAADVIAQAGVSDRVRAQQGDFFKDPFPASDVHFYSQIFHDWGPDTCARFAQKSFESLPSGGQILLHEVPLNDDRCGPLTVTAINVFMCLHFDAGRQYSVPEFRSFLERAGFRDVTATPTFGDWQVIRGRKP